jgi:hypothetical protein
VPLIFSTRAHAARQEEQDRESELMRGEEKLERARKEAKTKAAENTAKPRRESAMDG